MAKKPKPEVVRRDAALACVPTTWLDPLHDIENLFRAIRQRIEAIPAEAARD